MEGTKVRGFIRAVLVDKNDNVVMDFTQNNSTTPIWRALLSRMASELIYAPRQMQMGMTYADFNVFFSSNRPYYGSRDKLLNLMLVNSTEALSAFSTQAPILTNGVVDNNKLIGKASNLRTTTNPKEGIIGNLDDIDGFKMNITLGHWVFEAGVGTGDINKILMVLGGKGDSVSTGGRVAKGVIPVDTATYNGSSTFYNTFIRPNAGVTSATEILIPLDYSSNVAKGVFNHATGKAEKLAESDPRYGIPLGDCDVQQVYHQATKCLYYVNNGTLYKYNTETKENTSLGSCGRVMIQEGDILYYGGTVGTGRSSQLYAYNMATQTSGATKYLSEQAGLSNLVGSNGTEYCLSGGMYMYKNLDGQYVVVRDSEMSSVYGFKENYIFTNLDDIAGSIVGVDVGALNFGNEYLVNGKVINYLHRIQDGFRSGIGIDGYETQLVDSNKTGVKYMEGTYGDLLSYVELAAPIEKTADRTLHIYYGYEIL